MTTHFSIVKQLIYTSKATITFEENGLENLLVLARKKNAESGITGLLLFGSGHFIQVLEGTAKYVDKTFSSIEKDVRHTDIEMIFTGYASQRSYSGWDMASIPLWNPCEDGTITQLSKTVWAKNSKTQESLDAGQFIKHLTVEALLSLNNDMLKPP